ncbi:capsular polysaccharide export protein [Phyllobacterium trifolii]|uniref:Capsular polysaccharide export protein n=1 Tax=Phyllobacterium trifolii TaxID=300193 RepID=A0A839UMN2_9HYPH|nr:hypothetical protein [Phyllobacterium trifolii]MBB3149749.1 capsular polysaccharide export protein [Phyllobacterium trifolii]
MDGHFDGAALGRAVDQQETTSLSGQLAKGPAHDTPNHKSSRGRIVLLQGPVGPFFKDLQKYLNDRGFDAWRVRFNAGDRFFSNGHRNLDFAGDIKTWQTWFETFLKTSQAEFVILFGCEREIHRTASEIAKRAQIKVISLEEGYIRPGFVTVEDGGNNRMSPLAGSLPPETFVAPVTTAPLRNFTNSFQKMCWYGFVYYTLRNLLAGSNERKLFHKHRSIIGEAFLWIRNGYRRFTRQIMNYSTVERLLEHHDHEYYVVPLQVSDDLQIRAAAYGWNSDKLIMASMESFAKHAPSERRLVFKIHPLERGHSSHREFIQKTAEVHKISDRVDVIDAGSLGLLVRHSAGVITINSTSGLSAIAHGVPLLVIGEALYSHPDLAICAHGKPDFDSFWTSTFVADALLRRTYLSWIKAMCLKQGDYYSAEGRTPVFEEVEKTMDLHQRKHKWSKQVKAMLGPILNMMAFVGLFQLDFLDIGESVVMSL